MSGSSAASPSLGEPPSPPPAGWKAIVAVLFIALQLAVPLATGLFARHRPTVFGWQMFSRGQPRVEFAVRFEDGRVIRFLPSDIVMKDRPDIPFAEVLPKVLCQRTGAVDVVTITPQRERRATCD